MKNEKTKREKWAEISPWLFRSGNYKWYFETDARSHSWTMSHWSGLCGICWSGCIVTPFPRTGTKQNVFIGTLQQPIREMSLSASRALRNEDRKFETNNMTFLFLPATCILSECSSSNRRSFQIKIPPTPRSPGTVRVCQIEASLFFHQTWNSLVVFSGEISRTQG